MSKQICSACGANVSPYDGVSVGYKEGTKFMCSRCYNESMAEYLGLDYDHVSFDPLTLQDLDGVPHTFQSEEGVTHFVWMWQRLYERSRASIDEGGAFLKQHLRG